MEKHTFVAASASEEPNRDFWLQVAVKLTSKRTARSAAMVKDVPRLCLDCVDRVWYAAMILSGSERLSTWPAARK